MKEAIRVVLVDDQELYREGNALLLDATDDIVVVGEADTGEEALHAIAEAKPRHRAHGISVCPEWEESTPLDA